MRINIMWQGVDWHVQVTGPPGLNQTTIKRSNPTLAAIPVMPKIHWTRFPVVFL